MQTLSKYNQIEDILKKIPKLWTWRLYESDDSHILVHVKKEMINIVQKVLQDNKIEDFGVTEI